MRKYKMEVILKVIDELRNGDLPFKAIAKKYNLNVDYIYRLNKCNFKWMEEEGYVGPLRKTTHDIRNEIRERFMEGASEAQLQKEFGLDETQFQKIRWVLFKEFREGKLK